MRCIQTTRKALSFSCKMNPHRSVKSAMEKKGGRIFLIWITTVLATLLVKHIPIHLRLAGRGNDFALFLWISNVLGCLLMVLVTWLSRRVRSDHFTVMSISFTSPNRDLVISSLSHALQLCMVIYFLMSADMSAAGFPVANAVSFGLIPVFVSWLHSLVRKSPLLYSSGLHQVTMALLSSGLLYAASGLMKNGFYFTSMVSAIVAASLVASSKVYISLAYENNSSSNIVFFRLLAAVVVLSVYILIWGQPGAVSYWTQHIGSVSGYLIAMMIGLPLSGFLMLELQVATQTPFSSVVTDAVAWIISSLFCAFISKVDLYNTSLVGFLFVPFTVALHIVALLHPPPTQCLSSGSSLSASQA